MGVCSWWGWGWGVGGWGGATRKQAENWLQHKSSHAFTHARSRSGGGAGAKSAPQQMRPTTNFPRPLWNRALQTILVLKKWQICPRPLRVCENTRGSGAGMSKSVCLRSTTAPRICEHGFTFSNALYFPDRNLCISIQTLLKFVWPKVWR